MPGFPSVARSMPPGRPPPTLRITSCSARPMVLLARLPCPNTLPPLFIARCRRTGPFTTITGPTGIVVARTPWTLNSSVQAASTDASTTGRYSGLHPAITALIAIFSTVHSTRSGGATATISFGSRVVPVSMRITRISVGATTGSPSVQPRSNIASASSSYSVTTTRRLRRRLPWKRRASASATSGSWVRDPQPGRDGGRSDPNPVTPVIASQSLIDQPTVRACSTPASTRSRVGTVSTPRRYDVTSPLSSSSDTT